MNQQQSIDLFLKGREAWNEWAETMLREKAELEKAGKWQVTKEWKLNIEHNRSKSTIPETQKWLDRAFVDFSSLHFVAEQSSEVKRQRTESTSKPAVAVRSIFISGNSIDFNNFIFPGTVSFRGAMFTGNAQFDRATFTGAARFYRAEFTGDAGFDGAKFSDNTWFDGAKFSGDAQFDWATFTGGAGFDEATFGGAVGFQWATFRAARFYRAKFTGNAGFSGATFRGNARFSGAKFTGTARFSGATFTGKVNFSQADFERQADFSYALFSTSANFEAILSKRAFSLADAEFTTEIPNFNQANFAESPRVDNVKIITPPKYNGPTQKVLGPLKWQRYFWQEKFIPYLCRLLLRLPLKLWQSITCPLSHSIKWAKFSILKFTNHKADTENESRYRALKRLAIQSHDHVNEMEFFAGEIRSRRNVKDSWEPISHGPASFLRWWVGVLYELTSDFGRSFSRPFICWALALVLFSLANLYDTGLKLADPCQNSTNMKAWQAAYSIGLKNAVPLLGLTKTDNVKRAEACLYGSAPLYGTAPQKEPAIRTSSQPNPRLKTNYQTINPSKQNLAPDVPFTKTILGIGHSILSLIFIFLLLLALRNQFRIK